MNFFTKSKKRIISLVLCVLMMLPFAVTGLGAADTDDLNVLRDQFTRYTDSNASLLYPLTYSAFSPISNTVESSVKYPLVVFIGDATSQDYMGKELESNFVLWSSKEYQTRFYGTGGAFLMFIRNPISSYEILDSFIVPAINSAISNFISKNGNNIDTQRIYVVSWADGCKNAVKVVANNSHTFDALILCSPTYLPSDSEFTKMADVPMWLFACEADPEVDFNTYNNLWNGIKTSTADLLNVRYTTFATFGTDNRSTWESVAHDMNFDGQTSTMKTINGRAIEGKPVAIDSDVKKDGVIGWLSKLGSDYGSNCTCQCHSATGFAKLMWMIKMLFSMMLKIEKNKICDCGKAHY